MHAPVKLHDELNATGSNGSSMSGATGGGGASSANNSNRKKKKKRRHRFDYVLQHETDRPLLLAQPITRERRERERTKKRAPIRV